MRFVPYVVAVLAVVAAVLLRRRRAARAGRRPSPARRVAAAARSGPAFLGDTGIVAAREVHERLRGRIFKVVTLLLMAVVAAAVVIPTVHLGSTSTARIGVVGTLPPSLGRQVVHAATQGGTRPRLVHEPSLEQARAGLQSGHLDLVIVDRRSLLTKTSLGSGATTGLAEATRSVASTLGIANAFEAAHLSAAQAAELAGAKPVPVKSLVPPKQHNAATSASVVGLILVFVMLSQYNTWTLMGVMEEKSSRVVEVLLATVRPIQLLAGKILGIGLLVLFQAGLVVATALVLAEVVGSDLLHGTAPMVVVATLVWLVLGFAFYCWVYAAAGSTAERQDQVQNLVLPLTVPMILGYIVALSSAASANPSLLLEVLAYLPPTAPFAMPVLVAGGWVSWWGFLLSVAITLVSTVAVARLAAGVYRRAVLRTGSRVRIRELLASAR